MLAPLLWRGWGWVQVSIPSQWKPGRDVAREEASPIVPLVEKQADRTACAEAERELDAILPDDKFCRRARAEDVLRRVGQVGFP